MEGEREKKRGMPNVVSRLDSSADRPALSPIPSVGSNSSLEREQLVGELQKEVSHSIVKGEEAQLQSDDPDVRLFVLILCPPFSKSKKQKGKRRVGVNVLLCFRYSLCTGVNEESRKRQGNY